MSTLVYYCRCPGAGCQYRTARVGDLNRHVKTVHNRYFDTPLCSISGSILP